MKLVLQITAAMVLSFLLIAGIWFFFSVYMLKASSEMLNSITQKSLAKSQQIKQSHIQKPTIQPTPQLIFDEQGRAYTSLEAKRIQEEIRAREAKKEAELPITDYRDNRLDSIHFTKDPYILSLKKLRADDLNRKMEAQDKEKLRQKTLMAKFESEYKANLECKKPDEINFVRCTDEKRNEKINYMIENKIPLDNTIFKRY